MIRISPKCLTGEVEYHREIRDGLLVQRPRTQQSLLDFSLRIKCPGQAHILAGAALQNP